MAASTNKSSKITLQEQLDLITQNTRALVQPERLAISERMVAELFATGIETGALKSGNMAPPFSLRDSQGRTVKSTDLLALGSLIVGF